MLDLFITYPLQRLATAEDKGNVYITRVVSIPNTSYYVEPRLVNKPSLKEAKECYRVFHIVRGVITVGKFIGGEFKPSSLYKPQS